MSCQKYLYFDTEDKICKPCEDAMGPNGECTTDLSDKTGDYASVDEDSVEYPTYTATYLKCKEGFTVLDNARCCPKNSKPSADNTKCLPDEGLYAYHSGYGNFVNHFTTVSKLECIASGMAWQEIDG